MFHLRPGTFHLTVVVVDFSAVMSAHIQLQGMDDTVPERTNSGYAGGLKKAGSALTVSPGHTRVRPAIFARIVVVATVVAVS